MFEWDEAKRQSNIQRRGMDFLDAVDVFDGRPVITYASVRESETRFVTVGKLQEKLWSVVWTERESRKRIISAYRADNADRKRFEEIYP
jgi:uncharacterized DUF497 family protein